MSCFFSNFKEAFELNINAEYNTNFRQFDRRKISYKIKNSYDSCLFLIYLQQQQNFFLPNRLKDYKMHFSMYQNNDSLIIVKTETSLHLPDQDAIVNYEIIKPLIGCRTVCCNESWRVSYDKIEFSRIKPSSFITYSLICSGEWWRFDKGIILNGIRAFDKYEKCKSIFIYYELHSIDNLKIQTQSLLSQQQQQQQQQQQSSENATIESTLAASEFTLNSFLQKFSLKKNALLPPISSSSSSSSLSQNNPPTITTTTTTTESTTTAAAAAEKKNPTTLEENSNDDEIIQFSLTKNKLKYIVPSLYWFNARKLELDKGDLIYFIPELWSL